MYVCLKHDGLYIVRSNERHVHKGTGCTEHKCPGPCPSCIDRNMCTKQPCFMASSGCLTGGSLASMHMIAKAQIQLSSEPAKIHSPQIIYQKLLEMCPYLRQLTGSGPYVTGSSNYEISDILQRNKKLISGPKIELLIKDESSRWAQELNDVKVSYLFLSTNVLIVN